MGFLNERWSKQQFGWQNGDVKRIFAPKKGPKVLVFFARMEGFFKRGLLQQSLMMDLENDPKSMSCGRNLQIGENVDSIFQLQGRNWVDWFVSN